MIFNPNTDISRNSLTGNFYQEMGEKLEILALFLKEKSN